MRIDHTKLENQIFKMGREILGELSGSSKRSFFDTQYYTEKFMSWGMQDDEFKISLFRFVDVLPSLTDSASLIQHVHEYFEPLRDKIPDLLAKGLDISPRSIAGKLAAAAIRKQVSFVAQHFILGETPKEALKSLRRLRKDGQAFTVDLLGEATVSEAEATIYLNRYRELLHVLSTEIPKWPERAPLIPGHRGETTPINISVKLSALYSQARPLNTEKTQQFFTERLMQIVSDAKKVGAFVYVDMEDSTLTGVTIQAFKSVFSTSELRSYDRCGIVLQAYLRRTAADLRELTTWVKSRGAPVAVRLVKGAYWDTETILAEQFHWPVPVWQHKECSDANYEDLSIFLLENHELLMPAFASHNVRSLVHAIKAAEMLGVPSTAFELQVLYGMSEQIARAFASRGYLVRHYSPVGDLIVGMGYLVRRLLENTSNEGFLRQAGHDGRGPDVLLKRPQFIEGDTGREHLHTDYRKRFSNVPLRDFTVADERQRILREVFQLKAVNTGSSESIQPLIEGKLQAGAGKMSSIAPENPDLVLAEIELASAEQAKYAIESTHRFFPTWRATPLEERVELLFRVAELFQARRAALTATIILEAGKPWAEADADVAEAIDFLNYYAHEARRLFKIDKPGRLPGEDNSYFHEPRGVTVVISPWNFPLAIPCGMFAAALVTGNTVILKPAEQTSLIAAHLFRAFLDAGMPPHAAAFVPGIGEEIGPVLVNHPAVATVVFTGSRDVGMLLLTQGAQSSRGAVHVKRIIAEMGGKNAIIVDEDADLDEAVRGIVTSAFNYSGQKCSACSRAILVGQNYDRFLERLREAIRSIPIGAPSDPSTLIGPVIDEDAFRRITQTIEKAKTECTVVAEASMENSRLSERGYYVPPIAFAGIPENHPILVDEIFGPVLAIVPARSFDEALRLANQSEYGLTGAVFSRSPANIQLASREFRVGNLYINRGSTGAMVMRQPFGGAKMSGVGSKAGGPDYLLQFVIPRSITENTMRRGFAPPGEEPRT